jgi:hypothetical protein
VFLDTILYRNLKLAMRFFWVKLHIEFAFHRLDPYGSGVKCPLIFYYRTYACNSFPGFLYIVSYRNLKLSMRFFWVKLDIEFAFHHRYPYGFRVMCPWIYHYRKYACNSFPGYFSTLFHIGTCNFIWVFFVLRYTSSLCFIIVIPMVLELSALGFFTIGHMHVIVFYHQKRGP